MMLSAEEEALVNAVRALPPEEATKILAWARQLADLSHGREIEWSDSWSTEDLADATGYSVRRFEERERDRE
jgi:hypothetical protein